MTERGRVLKREAAKRDLLQHYLYLAENAGLETAERFLGCAEESFRDLARRPAMGVELTLRAARDSRNPKMAGERV